MSQDKLLRTLVLGCLCQCMRAYLMRYSMINSRDETGRWLIKATKPVLGYLRKGNLQFPEQQVRSYSSSNLQSILLTTTTLVWPILVQMLLNAAEKAHFKF